MDIATLEQITPELTAALVGRRFGRVFQLTKNDLAVDLRLNESRYLFISALPADPRIYLVRRRLRDLERAAISPSAFAQALRKQLSNTTIVAVEQITGERVLEIRMQGESELGDRIARSLVVQLTGKSANVFITDERGIILDRARETRGDGQEIGTHYSPPERTAEIRRQGGALSLEGSVSEYLDRIDLEKRATAEYRSVVDGARARLKRALSKLERRKTQLKGDLASHGDADSWKRFGDVLLANVATAKRTDGYFVATDYFDESLPDISIPFENDDSITETAEKYFRKYTKARHARDEAGTRITATDAEIAAVNRLGAELERAVAEEDRDFISGFLVAKNRQKSEPKSKRSGPIDGTARAFTSSDGFEILVGRKAKDNDVLTFKIAKSLDIWMHAADYPGSHVVIRNPNRKEVPHRTLIEAAELAAFYSQGKAQVKAAVHYTQKKFVNKPKGAAPGLVSLSSFKTLLVEPKVPEALTV